MITNVICMKSKKRWKWVFLFSIAAMPLLLVDSCMQFRMNSSEIKQYFEKRGLEGHEHNYRMGDRVINYVQVGNDSLPLVLFVHGSPGSLSAFIHFLADTILLEKAQLISVDRPGFGSSNFGKAEPSLSTQVALLKPILEKHKDHRPITLVGHSLGGPVVARMAMEYPELIDGLVMVAPSIDPELEPNEWFRGPLALPFFKWILPRSIRASNDEIWKLKPELQEMETKWSSIRASTIVIQGEKDKLVPPGNADYAKKMLINAPLELVIQEDMTHFVPWSNPELIRDAILKLVAPQTPNLSAN